MNEELAKERDELFVACEAMMKAWKQDKPRSMFQLKEDMDAAYELARKATEAHIKETDDPTD